MTAVWGTCALFGFVAGVTGCLPQVAFECENASQCSRMTDGQCDAGNCTYPDSQCEPRRRYSDYADPAIAGKCVPPTGGTTSSNTTTSESSGETPTPSGWWDCGWRHRARIAFAGAPGPALVDFTVLVAIEHSQLPGSFAPSGIDLRFVDGDTVLAHEVDRFDPAGTSRVWVRVPELRTGENDGIDMYWDNPQADAPPPAIAWDEHHVGVWHFGDDVNDASATGAHGSDGSNGPTAAVIGDGRAFDSAGSGINVGSPAPLDDVFSAGGTLLAWVRVDALAGPDAARIAGKSRTDPGHEGWKFYLVDEPTNAAEPKRSLGFQRDGELNPAAWSGPTDAIAVDDVWRLLAVSLCEDLDTCGSVCADDCGADDCTPAAGVRPRLFVNGEPVVTVETRELGPPLISDAGDALIFGRGPDGGEGLVGGLDEVRISRTVRCDSWIRAEYLSSTGALALIGEAETSACMDGQ